MITSSSTRFQTRIESRSYFNHSIWSPRSKPRFISSQLIESLFSNGRCHSSIHPSYFLYSPFSSTSISQITSIPTQFNDDRLVSFSTSIDKSLSKQSTDTSNPVVLTWTQWISSPQAMKESIMHELIHYRNGFKLLSLNVWSTAKILSRLLNGHRMTRRERELLVRTTSDLFRMVPFMIILIIPFMELALPFILKFFPEMLPSTFDDKLKKKENIKKQLNLKIEMARFLQDTFQEMKSEVASENPALHEFLDKLKSGSGVSPQEFYTYAKVFDEDLTLDNLQRTQLTAMCQLLNIKPFGTDTLLRIQIQHKVDSLKKDDKYIMEEGIQSLSLEELQRAVLARGMWSQTKNKKILQDRLQSWLNMSLINNVPITLLILSRAFALTSRAELQDTLKDILSRIPSGLIDKLETRIEAKALGKKSDLSFKLEVLERYSELVEEERQANLAAGYENIDLNDHQNKFVALATLTTPTELERLQIEDLKASVIKLKLEVDSDVLINTKELQLLNEELDKQKEEAYQSLKAEISRQISSIESDQREGLAQKMEQEFEATWKATREQALNKHLEMQYKRNKDVATLRRLEGRLAHLVDELKEDVVVAKKELHKELKFLDRNYDGLISEDELKFALTALQEKLTDQQIQEVLNRLDIDHDGLIEVRHLFKVARELDIDINPSMVGEVKKREQSSPRSKPLDV